MADDGANLPPFLFRREPPPRALTRVRPIARLVAPNASPSTFNGTCTYSVRDAIGSRSSIEAGRRGASLGARRRRSTASGSRPSHHPYPSRRQRRRKESFRRRRARGWSAPRRRTPLAMADRPRLRARPRLCAGRHSRRRRASAGCGRTTEARSRRRAIAETIFALRAGEANTLGSGDHVTAGSTRRPSRGRTVERADSAAESLAARPETSIGAADTARPGRQDRNGYPPAR